MVAAPHVGGAIDSMAMIPNENVELRLQDGDENANGDAPNTSRRREIGNF